MNEQAVRQNKLLVGKAMYELSARRHDLPGGPRVWPAALPEPPPNWNRRFPVFRGSVRRGGLPRGGRGDQTDLRSGELLADRI